MARTNGSVALSSSSCGEKGEKFSVGFRDGWGLLTCAYFGMIFPNFGSRKNLGSPPPKKALSASPPPPPPSSSSSSGFKEGRSADMGSENKDYRNDKDCLPSLLLNRQQAQSLTLFTLPTILTLGRVAAVPLLVWTFYVDDWWGKSATTIIFIAAAITDWLDGYIARKMRLITAFGAFLDPVADKLMVGATLVLLCTRPLEVAAMFGEIPWLLTVPSIAIIGREITMSAVREWAATQNSKFLEAVAVNNLGKLKTATQMTALTVLLATRDSSLTGSGMLAVSGIILLYISAGLAVWSLAVYMRNIRRVLLK